MSIADKLTTIAENQQKVYDAGFAAGQASGGGSGSYDEGYEAGIEYGRAAEHLNFWNYYQGGGATDINYHSAFRGYRWNDNCYNPAFTIRGGDLTYAFNMSLLTDTKVRIKHSGSVGSSSVFANARSLKTIRLLEVSEKVTFTSWFQNCTALENITFDGVIGNDINFAQSNLLTTESVQSIIDHLKDLTGATARTLTLHADVGAKLTAEQKAAITAKNWTVTY